MALAYRAARGRAAYRAKRGQDAQDALSTAAEIMEQGRAFVADCLAAYYIQDLNLRRRFPTFPAGHAGAEQAGELKRQFALLNDKRRHSTTDANTARLQTEIDVVLDQALTLYGQGPADTASTQHTTVMAD